MVADSVDYDLLRSRRNREGLYSGVWKMGTQVSRAGGLVLWRMPLTDDVHLRIQNLLCRRQQRTG